MALSAFSDVQLSFIASESKAARKQAVEAAGLKTGSTVLLPWGSSVPYKEHAWRCLVVG